jgi:predicted oxidoreductase
MSRNTAPPEEITMDRIPLSRDLSLSRLVYGMWRLADDADTSPEHVRNKIAACLDQGITTMDQAAVYGGYTAEEVLGDALAGTDLRDRIEIVTKCGIVAPVGRHASARVPHYDTSRRHILDSVDHSLMAMRTDRIDLLLVHRPDPFMDHIETGATLDALVFSGKVRAVGVSNFRPHDWTLLQSAMKTPLKTNQIELSVAAHHGFTNGDVAFHQTHDTPIMAWSPLAGGALFRDDPATARLRQTLSKIAVRTNFDTSAIAVAWLLAHPAKILPVLGTNSLNRIKRISQALEVPMDRETWFEIYTGALGHNVP